MYTNTANKNNLYATNLPNVADVFRTSALVRKVDLREQRERQDDPPENAEGVEYVVR